MKIPYNQRGILLSPDVNDGGGSSAASTDVNQSEQSSTAQGSESSEQPDVKTERARRARLRSSDGKCGSHDSQPLAFLGSAGGVGEHRGDNVSVHAWWTSTVTEWFA